MKSVKLEVLRDKCLLFNQFIIEKGHFPEELLGCLEESKALIEVAYENGNLKSLRGMSNDIDNQVARYMPLSMALELKILFMEKLGVGFEAVNKARLKAINRVLKKGKISSSDEYELLIEYIDEIYSDSEKSIEVERLNEILATFENEHNAN